MTSLKCFSRILPIAHRTALPSTDHPDTLMRRIPVKRLKLKDGETLVASVYDLFLANYGVDQGFGGEHMPSNYDDLEPYTPAWAEKDDDGAARADIAVARGFAANAERPTASRW